MTHAPDRSPRSVEVHRARASDEDAVWLLVEAFATSSVPRREAFAASFTQVLRRDDVVAFVAVEVVDGDRAAAKTHSTPAGVVGYALVQLEPTFFANGPVAWVQEVMVDARARRGGVGGALMAAVERWADERGAAYVSLASRRAGPFYEALGYAASATFFKRTPATSTPTTTPSTVSAAR